MINTTASKPTGRAVSDRLTGADHSRDLLPHYITGFYGEETNGYLECGCSNVKIRANNLDSLAGRRRALCQI